MRLNGCQQPERFPEIVWIVRMNVDPENAFSETDVTKGLFSFSGWVKVGSVYELYMFLLQNRKVQVEQCKFKSDWQQ